MSETKGVVEPETLLMQDEIDPKLKEFAARLPKITCDNLMDNTQFELKWRQNEPQHITPWWTTYESEKYYKFKYKTRDRMTFQYGKELHQVKFITLAK